ncbi:hypothetical protein CF326_g7746 [Tilletia indica]|nr:hypothetical protein CF326_g7746 [Tilletia indica]
MARLFPYPESPIPSTAPRVRIVQHNLESADASDRYVCSSSSSTEEDWLLLLLHNLGTDHARHRFSSNHRNVKPELVGTDSLVRNVLASLTPAFSSLRK